MMPRWGFARRSIPNTGSTARDHLANERTWLAWTRTSLGLVAFGLGWERFDLLREDVREAVLQAGVIQQARREKGATRGTSAVHVCRFAPRFNLEAYTDCDLCTFA
jgi:uncharacterized membrane protein YidH (DUF202 family)